MLMCRSCRLASSVSRTRNGDNSSQLASLQASCSELGVLISLKVPSGKWELGRDGARPAGVHFGCIFQLGPSPDAAPDFLWWTLAALFPCENNPKIHLRTYCRFARYDTHGVNRSKYCLSRGEITTQAIPTRIDIAIEDGKPNTRVLRKREEGSRC